MLIKNKKSLFTLIIILFPILSRYSAGIPFLTLAEVLVMVIILGTIVLGQAKIRVERNLMIFCAYLLVEVILAFIRGIASFDLIGSAFRLFFYYAIIAFFAVEMFDITLGKKMLLTVGVISGAYGIIQVVFSYMSIYLPTYIRFLTLMGGIDSDAIILERVNLGMRYRTQSIFNEPAHLCTYLVLVLAMLLFSEVQFKHWKIYAVIVSAACIISLSSTGIICVAILWGTFFETQIRKGKMERNIIIGDLLTVIVSLFVMIRFNILQYFLIRTFANTGKLSGILQSSRFGDLKHTFDNMDSILHILFGSGIVDLSIYLPGFARLFYCLGFVGFVTMLLILLRLYKSADTFGRRIMSLYIVLNLGTEIMFGNFLVLYLPFIICKSKEFEIDKEVTLTYGK